MAMGTALLKSLLPIWIVCVGVLIIIPNIYAQSNQKKTGGVGLKKEIFFLNLEDGFFGCQVNESVDVLQLFELSKLCDGTPQCFMASDELHRDLKCTDDCAQATGKKCQNGACLESQCHCNDGFGGKGCEVPDVNECKSRPCDIFAHCTNTLGSYKCTCFPGYEGNGVDCKDIDECAIPEFRSRCVENSECCNLPAHFICKCLPGYEGDGEDKCTDVNECADPHACGENALCHNTAGNYSCSCSPGFEGNPYDKCVDINECNQRNACAEGSRCINLKGSHQCECPKGYRGNGFDSCIDINECAENPKACGPGAICTNLPGTYQCTCSEGTTGQPNQGCTDLDECAVLENPCGTHAICENTAPGYNCLCPQGYAAKPDPKIACEQTDVTTLCKSNYDCVNNAECIEGQCFCVDGFKAKKSECVDVNECESPEIPCGPNSVCINTPGRFRCDCDFGFIGAPPSRPCKAPCEGVQCGQHAFCRPDGPEAYCVCEDGWSFDPNNITAGCLDINECDVSHGPSGMCGTGATCTNLEGGFSCSCPHGFTGNSQVACIDINECNNPKGTACGEGATCINSPGSFECACPDGTVPDPDPRTKCIEVIKCNKDDDCPGNAFCDSDDKKCLCPEPNIGKDCRHPCEELLCSKNAECMLINGESRCLCRPGYTGAANNVGGCEDINECSESSPCGSGAVCKNLPGSFSCECPGGSQPINATVQNPFQTGCKSVVAHECDARQPCPSGEQCVASGSGQNVCICLLGFARDQSSGKCRDIDECLETTDKLPCGLNAVCKNLPGSYACNCPAGYNGNPFLICEECTSEECKCQPPYKVVNGSCVFGNCSSTSLCPDGANCITVTGGLSYCACPAGSATNPDGSCTDINECAGPNRPCSIGAECHNKIVHVDGVPFECICPDGTNGDPYNGACSPSQVRCAADSQCRTNEKCIQPGECICPPPFFTDSADNNKCKSPCERMSCGVYAKCIPNDVPICVCEAGFEGDPNIGCIDTNECGKFPSPCGTNSTCVNTIGGYECKTDRNICRASGDCPASLICKSGTCSDPCLAGNGFLPCGENAVCEAEDHAAWCRCLPGYVKGANDACISVCLGVQCGTNAYCAPSSEGVTCKCQEGTTGNPFPGGQCNPEVCATTHACQEPMVCISGRCKEKCGDSLCGIGAKCDRNSNQCVCPEFFVGNPKYKCVAPAVPPTCQPNCGTNAHCEYQASGTVCVCNAGTIGNPYETCGAEERSCSAVSCGPHAVCRDSGCVCETGYQGNQHTGCVDINECDQSTGGAKPCGANAICINLPGSYRCFCGEGYEGNPFEGCTKPPVDLVDCSKTQCKCTTDQNCPTGFSCQNRICKDLCSTVTCGLNSVCVSGKCECAPGYVSSDQGCKPQSCRNDGDCTSQDICFTAAYGLRKCVDGCSRIQCGPNALCITENHKPVCICQQNYVGNPSNLQTGCTVAGETLDACKADKDCSDQQICRPDLNGIKHCVSPCLSFSCPLENEFCITKNRKPQCQCLDNYIRNPETSLCELPAFPNCNTDKDCAGHEVCKPDGLGVLRCTSVCAPVNCPSCNFISCSLNAECVAVDHTGICQCLPGHTGNPKDRVGCVKISRDQCQSDVQCNENEVCLQKDGQFSCVPVCNTVQCGPGAVCVSNNHAAVCKCPSGKFTGDPNDMSKGCIEVPCVYNDDCPPTQLCDRLAHKCMDICAEDTCGTSAVCIADNHSYQCICPSGFKPDPHPDIGCISEGTCENHPCHPSAICDNTAQGVVCKCAPGTTGDAYRSGCVATGSNTCASDETCPPATICESGVCKSVCQNACGANSVCSVENRKAKCSCVPGFEQGPGGCVRQSKNCTSDAQCDGSLCIRDQCKIICRNPNDCADGERCVSSMCMLPCIGHLQCPGGQACAGGFCVSGCRTSGDCLREEACVHHQCSPVCEVEGACGANSLCRAVSHSPLCHCPEGFQGNPTPLEGCVRKPSYCSTTQDCSDGQLCLGGLCVVSCTNTADCARGERCQNNVCVKVCYTDSNCQAGEVCVEGACHPGCRSDSDCKAAEVCISNKCRCGSGFDHGPTGCRDINECDSKPCHSSASCLNTPGSYKCICPAGLIGEPYEQGCRDGQECQTSEQCPENMACLALPDGKRKCSDPCVDILPKCGPRAKCQVSSHIASCVCEDGELGDPFNKDTGCYVVECTNSDDCSPDRQCDQGSNRCVDLCLSIGCGKGACQVHNHAASCICSQGFEFRGNLCVDVDECAANPCHPSAVCKNTVGSFACSCPAGTVRDQLGCKKAGECFTDVECPDSAFCKNGKCVDVCEGSCGKNAQCSSENHQYTCSCPEHTQGDPARECISLECVDGGNDCPSNKACFGNKCIDICALGNICGKFTNCSVVNGRPICTCLPGHLGDPRLGCVPVTPCSESSLCPPSSKCSNGICRPICNSKRDCIADQLCIEGVCQAACKANTDCASFQKCLNGICQELPRCQKDDDCPIDEMCRENKFGQLECQHVCSSWALCGRNAECSAHEHQPKCECKPGFFGNAHDDRLGCQPIECNKNDDCSKDKVCSEHKCQVACRVSNPCVEFAVCISENHQSQCQCQPGFTGNPAEKCTSIDFCSQKPCGPNAVCDNTRGSFKCFCSIGTVGDAYTSQGCLPVPECKTNADCPEATRCVRRSGSLKCTSVCEDVKCGPNAECRARGTEGVCLCRDEYQGNPKDLIQGCRPKPKACKSNSDCGSNTFCDGQICKPPCAADTDCNASEVCVRSQCLNACDAPGACGLNAACTPTLHRKVCNCPPGFTGNAEVECVRIAVPCQNNHECAAGYKCTEGLCLLECREDGACAMNERCLEGKCLLTCRVDNDCFLSHICLNNMCLIGCRTSDDCSGGESCIGQKCSDPCKSQGCGANSVCNVVNHQPQCSCPGSTIPNPTPLVGCVREPKVCTGNRDCAEGYFCESGSCLPICSTNGNCFSNEICDKGLCKPVCRVDGDCRNGEVCDGLSCIPGCRSDDACLDSQVCSSNKCVDPCTSPIACGLNAQCAVKGHEITCRCLPGLVGDSRVGCKVPEVPCDSGTSCAKPMVCIEKMCRKACRADANCLADERCIGGVCKPLCSDDEQCGPGYICQQRVCLAGCRSDSQCAEGFSCINRQCKDPCKNILCGQCATCQVVNHAASCSCPAGTIGDALISCVKPPQRCTAEGKCPRGSKCDGGYCSVTCTSNGNCACGQTCSSGFCRSQCSDDAGCPQGQLCQRGQCVAGCRQSSDCAPDSACSEGECIDPCQHPKSPCGKSAICKLDNKRQVICLCPNGYFGEPSKECVQLECGKDSDCSAVQVCHEGVCVNPCIRNGACGVNAVCRVANRRAVCSCPIGHAGNPLDRCTKDVNECLENPCGQNAQCIDTPSGYKCTCARGCSGDPTRGCVCKIPSACSDIRCGTNAICLVDSSGVGRCSCPSNHPLGNPLTECKIDRIDDCRTLGCGKGALCVNITGQYTCQCPVGTSGNPAVFCVQEECRQDSDCPSHLNCFNNKCGDLCQINNRCNPLTEKCEVRNHILTCIGDTSPRCPGGAVWDPINRNCGPAEAIGCRSDDECGTQEACRNGVCINPCRDINPCAPSAICEVVRHQAKCSCSPGLVGDPYRNCFAAPPVPQPECTQDNDCADDKACVSQVCQSVCAVQNPCAANAICRAQFHRPLCVCPVGWAGNPQVRCYQPECVQDSDCPTDRQCISEKCVDPCRSSSCPVTANCRAVAHRAQCYCPPGSQGNPLISCVVVGCSSDNDCNEDESCDHVNRVCRRVCTPTTCAQRAYCEGRNHQAICQCPSNTRGDPYVRCIEDIKKPSEPERECEEDSNCRSHMSCVNFHCVDPCAISNPCSPLQQCRVMNTLPFRAIVCECPSDTKFVNGACVRITTETEGCKSDSDCNLNEKCQRGACIDACLLESCGYNAICRAANHNGICYCPAGLEGDPRVRCAEPPRPKYECVVDADCADDLACTNNYCSSPCNTATCAPNALCHVEYHNPICRCPQGLEGNPRIECKIRESAPPQVGCASSDECPSNLACINRACVNPCQCGPNAQCNVQSHIPICTCSAGYSGNPNYGCFQLGCSHDGECANTQVCSNRQCIDACRLSNPCAITATCFGQNHRSNCKCLPGLEGDPFVRCESPGCSTHNDCPLDKVCKERKCVNPCYYDNRCASNAVCRPANHAAICHCPENLPRGNPFSFCERLDVVAPPPQCVYDYECDSGLACFSGECKNPCTEIGPCDSSAVCKVINSTPVRTLMCICPENWAPNENGQCRPVVPALPPPGCTSDNECPSDEACINSVCRSPCLCGQGASCHVTNHRSICSCKEGFEGNPNIACYPVGCRSDDECDSNKACVQGECVNICLLDHTCGTNADCIAIRHRAECQCRPGFRGDPYVACKVIGCTSNDECPLEKACINSDCQIPCQVHNPCAPSNSICTNENHQATCRCLPSFIGNPYISCDPEPKPECVTDADCPSQLACIDDRCQQPCHVLRPCLSPAACKVVDSVPVRTMICICPDGYAGGNDGTCRPVKSLSTVGCTSDSECGEEHACINAICRSPCQCGPGANCRIVNHKPICTCLEFYEGNPDYGCYPVGCRSNNDCPTTHACLNRNCEPVCAPSPTPPCARNAVCHGIAHTAICKCPAGAHGDPYVSCITIGCETSEQCPSDKSCINSRCESPCAINDPCASPSECRVHGHVANCTCPPGFSGSRGTSCQKVKIGCEKDEECPSQLACIDTTCKNPCLIGEPCGVNAQCRVVDTLPVRTMICECLPGYRGNAAIKCDLPPVCPFDKGYVLDANGKCICPPGFGLDENDNCIPCPFEEGYKVNERGRCICATDRGMIIDNQGKCICPVEQKYVLRNGYCEPIPPDCVVDDDCPDDRFCYTKNSTCITPCLPEVCPKSAYCLAIHHAAVCQCPEGTKGNPTPADGCIPPPRIEFARTDFPPPAMTVNCLADGVQVDVNIQKSEPYVTQGEFNGLLYVKGYSKDPNCRKSVLSVDDGPVDFKVKFGTCGLEHKDGEAGFVLVIQKHPKLVTYNAQAYHIKCVYMTGEKTITLGFNVSMLTTAGTIANTGPPPTCVMKIVTATGGEITSAEIGESLMLRVEVQPQTIYGGFARNCVAKTMDGDAENEYLVTDENGCATDPSIFGEWEVDPNNLLLLAHFNAFKFPSSSSIKFQCNVRVCFGKCQPVNCRGQNAFGRRKRQIFDDTDASLSTSVSDYVGQLREEVTVQSNPILALERREERLTDPSEAQQVQKEEVCVSMVGFIISLILTALLALVAVAVAVSCWLLAYRRRPKVDGPLPHPPEFPNPLFTTPEPLAEPSPDYLS